MPATLLPAARAFLAHEAARVPDFSACLVLLPHAQAGVAFRRALAEALPGRHLLPPRLTTLQELADAAVADLDVEADSLRLAQLRDFLDRLGHLQRATLWQAAGELLDLLDELDAAGEDVLPPASRPAPGNRHLSLEAEIVHQVWRAFAAGGAPGRARARTIGLRRLAQQAAQPLYVLGRLPGWGAERACLEEWRRRAGLVELPAPPADAACAALLETAWERSEPALAERARRFAQAQAHSPLAAGKMLLAAPGLEAAARAGERLILAWLGEGLRDIAVVATDRLLARRLRALLERHGILLQDETGWTFATASASHLPEAWLRLLAGDAWYRDLLDLLKSPYLFADVGAQRARAVHELDAAFRRYGAPDGLAGHLDLARRFGLRAALPLLQRIEVAGRVFAGGRQTLSEWTSRLLSTMRELAAEEALRADAVGRQLWALLQDLAHATAAHQSRYAVADWRRWLLRHLEQATFLDGTVTSPLRLTHLAAAHTRDWQAAIVLGVGAAQLPGTPRTSLFNEATRRQLGLPGTAQREEELRAALADVLARVPRVASIWQSEREGEPEPLSPWLVHLDAFHRAAWRQAWLQPAPSCPEAAAAAAPPISVPPAPAAVAVPRRLSVSAWQSLVACPYQFFARHVLGLNEPDEVPEEMDKADYGSLVHAILADFHVRHARLAGYSREALVDRLGACSRAVFAPVEAAHYLAKSWRLRWERLIPAYVDWALRRESQGYRFHAAEAELTREVRVEGGDVQLHGRADRLDVQAGGKALLDYKTQSRQTLKEKLHAGGEDVQLTTYAWLADADEAAFVSVDAEPVETLSWPGDLGAAKQAEAARLHAALADLAAGLPLPAQGAPTTCAWCEMRGLCRREHRVAPTA